MAFVAGQKLRASDMNAVNTSNAAGSGPDTTTTSITFVDCVPSVNFTAPPSGAVLIFVTADNWSSSGTEASEVDFRLSGATTRSASSGTALRVFGANGVRATVCNVITGLTAGGSYTCTMQQRSTNVAATAHAQNKGLIITTLGS